MKQFFYEDRLRELRFGKENKRLQGDCTVAF